MSSNLNVIKLSDGCEGELLEETSPAIPGGENLNVPELPQPLCIRPQSDSEKRL